MVVEAEACLKRVLSAATRSGGSTITRAASSDSRMPTGTFSRKTQRHEKLSVIQPPECRPDGRREHHGDAVDGESLAALVRRKRVGQDGLRIGLQAAAGDALQRARRDQQRQAGRQAAQRAR